MAHAEVLISKLDAFIRKYYRNQVIRGVLLTLAVAGSGWLVITGLEAWGRFGVTGRTALFWVFLLASSGVLFGGVVLPALRWFRIAGGLSYEEAGRIVGDHFPDIADRLLNTLQLQRAAATSEGSASRDLLLASIEQRTETLRPIPFTAAVNVRENLRYVKFALPPLLVLAILGWWRPEWVTEPAERLIAHRQEFTMPAPFQFKLVNEDLTCAKNSAFVVEVQTTGDEIPALVHLETATGRYRMQPSTTEGGFTYRFPAVRETVSFAFVSGKWRSAQFELKALPVPGVEGFTLTATTPSYTGRGTIVQENAGDINVPEGTQLEWRILPRDADNVVLRMGEITLDTEAGVGGAVMMHHRAMASATYWMVPSNRALGAPDSLRYQIHVVPDARPYIRVTESPDSTSRKQLFFSGEVRDDFGFSALKFHVNWLESDAPHEPASFNLPRPSGRSDAFFYAVDWSELGLVQGDVVEYHFEVWDNDGVHGAKSARTAARTFAPPSDEELREEREEESEAIEDQITQAIEEAKDLSRELEELRERLREDDELDYQDKRALEEFLKDQEALREQIREMQEANERKDLRASEFSETEERILQKQEQLQELLNEVMSDELRELYAEMQKLLEEMDPDLDQIQEQLEEMQVDQESLEKELDRALEQFKQMEWEVGMEEAMQDLEQLAQEQLDLAEETREESAPNEELQARQDSLNQAFNDLMERFEELEEKNEELENPNPMMDTESEEQSIQESMQESSDQLEKERSKKASEEQQKAGEEMQQMAQQMMQMQMQGESETLEEDMDALRALLENIITLSFDQEEVMEAVRTTAGDDPAYVDHGQTQQRLQSDARMVEDSLLALSKRVTLLAATVNHEIGLVKHHMGKALGGFSDRETGLITEQQQYVMTSFNNLALMLDEALRAMQQQMAEGQPGSGNCQKPGGNGSPSSSPSAGDMKKMQKALGEKLERMKGELGQSGGKGGRQMSKELAELAAQQAALRQMAEKKAAELNEDGSGNGNGMKQIAAEMEELERDLVNRNLDAESIMRQQDLMVRLLEAENAERIRGEDEQRKSRSGGDDRLPESPQVIDYLKLKEKETELLQTIPPELVPYYRERVNDYFNNLDLGPEEPQTP
jgi:hypothetical protein